MKERVDLDAASVVAILFFIVVAISAAVLNSLLVMFVAYCSFFFVLLHLHFIDPLWLLVETDRSMTKYFRSLILWPITLLEYQSHQKILRRIAVLTEALSGISEETVSYTDEWDELMKCYRKLAKFSRKARRYKA